MVSRYVGSVGDGAIAYASLCGWSVSAEGVDQRASMDVGVRMLLVLVVVVIGHGAKKSEAEIENR